MRISPAISNIVISCLCFLIAACGGGGGKGSLTVKLNLPQGVDPSIFSSEDRIVVRIYGSDFQERRHEFTRSQGKGSIEDVPEGEDRVIKVDEYDIQGVLLARGFSYGVRITDGQETGIAIVMVPKGWVITLAGGNGPGDSPDGTYAGDALLNGPAEVEYYQDKLFINDLSNRKLKIIDKYFRSHDIGNISDLSILNEGDSLENTNLPFPVDFIMDDYIYCLAADLQLFSIDLEYVKNIYYADNPGVIILDNGNNMLAGKNGEFFYSDYNEHKIYKINNGIKEIFVQRGINPVTVGEGIDKNSYGLLNPKGIYYDGSRLYFSDSGNNKIKYVENNLVFTFIGSYIDNIYYDGILTTEYNIKNPYYLKSYGDYFFVYESETGNIIVKKQNKLYLVTSNNHSPSSILQPLPPDSAGLINPRDVTVDPDGNLYIADTGNHAIRMVVGGAL